MLPPLPLLSGAVEHNLFHVLGHGGVSLLPLSFGLAQRLNRMTMAINDDDDENSDQL